MPSIDDRLAERQRKATEAAQAVTQPTSAANGQQPTEKPTETPPAPTEPPRQAKPARARQRADTAPQQPAEIDKATRNRWRTILQNSARKLAADRARLDESEEAWAATVTEARAVGVPANVILAAAADADIEVPE